MVITSESLSSLQRFDKVYAQHHSTQARRDFLGSAHRMAEKNSELQKWARNQEVVVDPPKLSKRARKRKNKEERVISEAATKKQKRWGFVVVEASQIMQAILEGCYGPVFCLSFMH